MEVPDADLIDFVPVAPGGDLDGLLDVPAQARLERVGPPSATVKPIAAKHVPHTGARGFLEKLTMTAKHTPLPAQYLFPNVPRLEDIGQQQLGDCWFLASLAAIVAMGSGWAIKYMMRSWGEDPDYAIVRLYDPSGAPRYLKVEKSLIRTNVPNKTFHSTGALWAALLEKAMTAVDFPKGLDLEGPYRINPEQAVYTHLHAGWPQIAFRALLGVEVRATTIIMEGLHQPDLESWNALIYILAGEGTNRPPQRIVDDLFSSVVGTGPGMAALFFEHAWTPWVQMLPPGNSLIDRFCTVVGDKTRRARGLPPKVLRQEDVEQILSNPPVQHQ
jgi:hypothetical protein